MLMLFASKTLTGTAKLLMKLDYSYPPLQELTFANATARVAEGEE